MANTKSAKKAIRVQERRRKRNVSIRTGIKTALKKANNAITGDDAEARQAATRSAISAVDKAVAKGIIHKNTAARKKSRLMKRLNSAN